MSSVHGVHVNMVSQIHFPRKVCQDSLFAEEVSRLAAEIHLLEQPESNQLYLPNKIIVESARTIRDCSLYHYPDGSDNVRLIVDSISRAIWKQDLKLCRGLILHSQLAREYLSIRPNNGTVLLHPGACEHLFVETRSAQQLSLIDNFGPREKDATHWCQSSKC